MIWFKKKKVNFRGFRVFDFLIPKIKNSEISEICLFFQILTVVIDQDLKTKKIWTERKTERFPYDFCLPRTLTLVETRDLKTPKKWTTTKTKRFTYYLEQNQNFPRFPSFRFCLYPKSNPGKSRKVLFYLIVYDFTWCCCIKIAPL